MPSCLRVRNLEFLFVQFVDEVWLAAVVSAAEVFFQPQVGADEEIAAAHFFDLQLGLAVLAVLPRNGRNRPGIAAHDGLQWNFHGEIEMRRQQRMTPVDHRAPIGLECVGRVVERNHEKRLDEKVGAPVDEELEARVIDHLPALDETTAKGALIAFVVEQAPVFDGVLGRIGGIGHHDDNGVASTVFEAVNDGATKAMRTGILLRDQRGNLPGAQFLQDCPSAILRTVVHHHDLMRDARSGEGCVNIAQRLGQGPFFVTSRHDDRVKAQRAGRVKGSRGSHAKSEKGE